MTNRVCLCVAALFIAVLVMQAGCRDRTPIHVGFIGGLTGRISDLSIAGRDGAILAMEEINAAGGINGRPLSFIFKDDRNDPAAARAAVAELIEERVTAIIGHFTSAMSTATIPLVNDAKMLMISPTTATPELNGRDDWFFKMNDGADIAEATADRIAGPMGIRSTAVIYDADNRPYAFGSYSTFRHRYVAQGGTITQVLHFNSHDKHDLPRRMRDIDTRRSGAAFIVAGALDAALICQRLHNAGFTGPLFVAEWASTNDFLASGGHTVNGIYVYQHYNSLSDTPSFLRFKQDFERRFGTEPSFASAYSYETVQVLADALRREPASRDLRKVILARQSYKGLLGPITINRFGDARRPLFLMQVRGGAFHPVDDDGASR